MPAVIHAPNDHAHYFVLSDVRPGLIEAGAWSARTRANPRAALARCRRARKVVRCRGRPGAAGAVPVPRAADPLANPPPDSPWMPRQAERNPRPSRRFPSRSQESIAVSLAVYRRASPRARDQPRPDPRGLRERPRITPWLTRVRAALRLRAPLSKSTLAPAARPRSRSPRAFDDEVPNAASARDVARPRSRPRDGGASPRNIFDKARSRLDTDQREVC